MAKEQQTKSGLWRPEPAPPARFVQLVARGTMLDALDAEGKVWEYAGVGMGWAPLTMDRQ